MSAGRAVIGAFIRPAAFGYTLWSSTPPPPPVVGHPGI